MSTLNENEIPSLKELVFGEEAQAMAEMVILLPVYLMLMVSMIYLGHIMLVRQQVLEATRWFAWQERQNSDPGSVNSKFFPRFSVEKHVKGKGAGRASPRGGSAPSFYDEVIDDTNVSGADNNAKALAKAVLSYNDRNMVVKRSAEVDFRYNYTTYGGFVGGWGQGTTTQMDRHSVYIWRSLNQNQKRLTFKESQNGAHPIIFNYTQNPPSGVSLEAFSPMQTPWQALIKARRQGEGPDIQGDGLHEGGSHANSPTLWNIRHDLNNSSTNPFFRKYFR